MNKSNIIIILVIFALLNNSLLFNLEHNTNTDSKEIESTENNSQKQITTTNLPKGIYIVVVDNAKKTRNQW